MHIHYSISVKFALFLCLLSAAHASVLSTATVWEINAAGASTSNSAGFDPSQLAGMAADLACTSATGATPDCTSATYNFVAADAGNYLYVAAGTNYVVGSWIPIKCASGTAGFGSGDTTCAANHIHLDAAVGKIVSTDSTKGYPNPAYVVNTVTGVATVASPTAGTWTVDYSQNVNSHANGTDLATVGNTNTGPCVISSATHNFTKNEVGNVVVVVSGTNFTSNFFSPIVIVSGNQATLENQACGGAAAVGSAGTYRLGGARPIDATISTAPSTSGGNRIFIKGTSATQGANVTFSGGASQRPNIIEGYNVTRGDAPTASGATDNRPVINVGVKLLTTGTNTQVYNIVTRGNSTAGAVFQLGTFNYISNIKCLDFSATAGQVCLQGSASGGSTVTNSELISYRGFGFAPITSLFILSNSYLHASDICMRSSAVGATFGFVTGNIFEGCVTGAYQGNAAMTGPVVIDHNTFYGAANKANSTAAVTFVTGTTVPRFTNNIITGWATGVSHADSQTSAIDDYNDYFNNTTDVSSWQKGSHDIALDPGFASVAQIVVTGGTGNSSTTITKVGAFTSITPLVDYVYITSGTGCTAGFYGIASSTTDTIVTDITNGCSSTDVSLQITTGHNFALNNSNLKSKGFPGAFPGALTTGFASIGAQAPQGTGAAQSARGVAY